MRLSAAAGLQTLGHRVPSRATYFCEPGQSISVDESSLGGRKNVLSLSRSQHGDNGQLNVSGK
jgi:hypothetical protein